jgi:hypothetical protein
MAENVESAVRRLVWTYDGATPDQLADGRTWYADAQAEARRLAVTGPAGFGIVRAAAVIAVLSANQSWQANVASARRAVRAARNGEDVRAACRTLGDSSQKAARILAGENPADVVSGPKVTVFWRAICGDPDAATIDRWAARAAGYPDQGLSGARAQALWRAYEIASDLVGENPRDFQAVCWVVERGRAG